MENRVRVWRRLHAASESKGMCACPLPRRRSGIEHGDASPRDGKKFAQIGAIGLVRREIRHPCGKFFLAAVQAVRTGCEVSSATVASSAWQAWRATSMKKKRVLPMFFFRRMSAAFVGDIRCRCGAAVARMPRRDAVGTTMEKKLREGVDT